MFLLIRRDKFVKAFRQVLPAPLPEAELNPERLFHSYELASAGLPSNKYKPVSGHLLDLARYLFDEEEARRARLETTAANLLNVLGVVAALVVGFVGILIAQEEPFVGLLLVGVVIIYGLTLIYLSAGFVLALAVLSHEPRYCLDPTDLVWQDGVDEWTYEQVVAKRLMEYTVANYRINNRQVNRLRVVRVLFRNAVLGILFAGLLLGGSMVLRNDSGRAPVSRPPLPANPPVHR
jgi:hypothetical protein